MIFDCDTWIDALDASGVHGKEAWLVAEALAGLMNENGAVAPAAVVSYVEASAEWCSLFDELEGIPAGSIFAEGCRQLADAHLLHDFGTRIVAVLPVIPIVYQEAL